MRIIGFIAVLITGALLLYAAGDLPGFGSTEAGPNANRTSHHYIEKINDETHVPNLVTAILADYRGYDTMFETVVVLTAGIAIIAILIGLPAPEHPGRPAKAPDDLIIQTTCRLLIPVIQLFALYVLAHGHYSPGGGFQGGVILGASFILYALAYDLERTLVRYSIKRAMTLAVIGVVVYAGHGVFAMMQDGNFLDYTKLDSVYPNAASWFAWGEGNGKVFARYHSMLGVEIGVLLTVSSIMFAIYANLASRGTLQRGL